MRLRFFLVRFQLVGSQLVHFLFVSSLMVSLSTQAAEPFVLPLESGDEVTVNVYSSTLGDADNPLLIWFTEAYASRKPFKHLITQLNDEGYDVWQVDLLDAYFLERTPGNVRSLTGEGVKAVLDKATKHAKRIVPISTGRMSLILLRGMRLWQVNHELHNGIGPLEQTILFFPNLFEAPEKAGDAPKLFPVVHASSLPITLVQTGKGTFKWKLPAVINALENNHSQITLAGIPDVRDWYFLRRDPNQAEQDAAERIPSQLEWWLQAGDVNEGQRFSPATTLPTRDAGRVQKGLVRIDPRYAPDFKLTDIDNQSIKLSAKRGKVVLLNFWASWCPPCVKEIPSMNRLAESFHSDDFEIVSVNFKEDPKTIESFLKRVQVDFPVLIDLDGQVSAEYEIFAFPSSFLIDAEGRIRYSVNTAIEWDEPELKAVIQTLID